MIDVSGIQNRDHTEHTRTGLSVEALKRAILDNLFYIQGRFADVATANDWYQALAYTVRDRLLYRWVQTAKTYKDQNSRTVCYLSAEYLLGPHLGNNIINLRIYDAVKEALDDLGQDLDKLLQIEEEPGLGSGGLGRLAACYMDSLATLQIPAIGYGIRYEFGIFDQEIQDGWQIEKPDYWLRNGNPWEISRAKLSFDVKFGGHSEPYHDHNGIRRVRWIPDRVVKGIAYDTPILGYDVANANLLRLWKAEAAETFDFQAFNVGDYYSSVNKNVMSESISKVLYPNDEPEVGKQLRLQQQYFFVTCSLQDMIRIYMQANRDLTKFHEKYAVQLNDTHPAIAVPELMRLLIDEHHMEWDAAWQVTRQTFSYTNHTLLPEALETWPLELMKNTLPRHVEIIYDINTRFLDEVRMKIHGIDDHVSRMSIIEENHGRYVRMAHLACVGSHSINGVAKLHTELLKNGILKDFYDLWPEKFSNKTNGVTQRRFLLLSNPGLSDLISKRIGCNWTKNLEELSTLEKYADDSNFQQQWRHEKRQRKVELAAIIQERTGIITDPDSMFDIQVKRLHEYKRQHLNLLHAITLYNRVKENPGIDIVPRTFIFGGKAAPGYTIAKLMIKLITSVANIVNRDPDVAERLKVVFFPDFNVKNAQNIYPAADLSEQISTAGMEASGTGNMKFSMNGALTIGTLDGANIEIREAVEPDNFFLFGMTADEVRQLTATGYKPYQYYEQHDELKQAIDLITNGYFSHGDTALFRPLINGLLSQDPYMVLADYPSYIKCQQEVSDTYRDTEHWTSMSILNVARIGRFSSDRAIREYCNDIWKVEPVPVNL
jgi:starch phosphorylase